MLPTNCAETVHIVRLIEFMSVLWGNDFSTMYVQNETVEINVRLHIYVLYKQRNIHRPIYTHTHRYIYIYTHTHAHTYIHTYTPTHTYVRTYIRT
jgi:hypothetical protein